MILYVYSKCSTCQNALRFLEKKGVKCEVREITLMPPTILELEAMLHFQQGNIKKLLNTSGLLYREMHLSEKLATMSQSEILSLLSVHGMLIKRPFLLGEDFGLTGFKEAEWAQVI
jgi:arsenate reductase